MEVPLLLAHLVTINVEFGVFLCLNPLCKRAVSAAGLVEHIRKTHHERPAIRKQLGEYVQDVLEQSPQFRSDYSTVQLPADGSIPQPVVPVLDGFSCRECRFLTTNRDNIRKHANKEHLKKRQRDKELFECVRLQSWFGQKRERYWVVDESKEPQPEPEPEPERSVQSGGTLLTSIH
jgi:hypothetical protein